MPVMLVSDFSELKSIKSRCMPELPEVESFRRFIDKTSLDQTIESIKIGAPNMLLKTSSRKLSAVLEGNSLTGTVRHGKFLFIRLKKNGGERQFLFHACRIRQGVLIQGKVKDVVTNYINLLDIPCIAEQTKVFPTGHF